MQAMRAYPLRNERRLPHACPPVLQGFAAFHDDAWGEGSSGGVGKAAIAARRDLDAGQEAHARRVAEAGACERPHGL
jgi:hypothetical protein